MAKDLASKPFDPKKEYDHVFLCRKYPMIRLVFKRREKAGDAEQYIGFLKHEAVGGVFQTNDKEVAEFLDSVIADGEHGHEFERIDHAELADMIASAEPVRTRVNRGAMASRQTERSEIPEDQPEAQRQPSASKGPRSKAGRPKKAEEPAPAAA
jgi:hypothetical protein